MVAECVRVAHVAAKRELSDDRLDSITEIWLRFPLPVCAACVGLDGIANEKLRDPRTGCMEPRRFVPSNPEIREWCNQYRADLHDIVKAAEIVSRPIESPPLAESWPSPSAQSIAHVRAKCRETVEALKQASGIPTAEKQRAIAERILEACREQV